MTTNYVKPPTRTSVIGMENLPVLPAFVSPKRSKLDTIKLGLLRSDDSVLFIGDSITDAFRKPEEINIAYQLGAGYALMIGAQLMREHPDAGLHFMNFGVSGDRVTHLAERWEKDCIALKPDVVSILAGVNSTLQKFKASDNQLPLQPDVDYDGFFVIYDKLIRDLVASNPLVRLVLCEPFLLPCGIITASHVEDVRQRADYVKRLAAKHDAAFVPFQAAFDEALGKAPAEYWAYDGIHPTAAGFWLMAETWVKHVVAES